MTSNGCDISVVLCTYNRAERLERVIQAVLAQKGCEFELVVVDDGSTDATPKVLASIDDERLRVVRRLNGGLSIARNTGLKHSRARWTVFLDDDDLPEDGWLATLAQPTSDPEVGITCCGVTLVDEDGREVKRHSPGPLGEPFGDAVGLFFAGSFAARTDLLRKAGGYLDGLSGSEQFELFVRLLAVARSEGLTMVGEDAQMLRIEERNITDRPMRNPRRLYDGTRWILARHPETFAGARTALARFEAIVGTTGARLGEWQAARRHFLRSVRARPNSWKGWGRLALATVPAVGQRVWGQHDAWSSHNPNEIGILRQRPSDDATGAREFFLAWQYRENPPASSDAIGNPYWAKGMASGDIRFQGPVYRLAARLARKRGWTSVLDVGCGTGHKLVNYLGRSAVTTGVDQPSAIALARQQFPECRWLEGDLESQAIWDEVSSPRPDLTLCADVIEHVEDPIALLHRLAEVSAGSAIILSTPDTAVSDAERPLGPPLNPRHIREWTHDQFELLLLSTGFEIERSWHLLPRSYSLARTDFNRAVYRALTLKPVPDHRSCMVFLLRGPSLG